MVKNNQTFSIVTVRSEVNKPTNQNAVLQLVGRLPFKLR